MGMEIYLSRIGTLCMFPSVIIPVNSSEKYLSYCIESILNQTLTAFEVILVNDESSSNSEAICRDYSLKYSYVETYTIARRNVYNSIFQKKLEKIITKV